jgi:hypothetical protein
MENTEHDFRDAYLHSSHFKQPNVEQGLLVHVLHPPQNFEAQSSYTVKAMGLTPIQSRSPSMASPSHIISSKPTNRFRSY